MRRGFEAPWGPRSKMAILHGNVASVVLQATFPAPIWGKVGRPPNQATSQDWIFRAQEQKSHLQHHLKSAKAMCEMTGWAATRASLNCRPEEKHAKILADKDLPKSAESNFRLSTTGHLQDLPLVFP